MVHWPISPRSWWRVREIGSGVAYLTDQTHASLVRNLRQMGLGEDQIRILPSDDGLRMDLAALDAALVADQAAGRRPMMVVATAGTTNSGAVDPLPELAERCARWKMWLHVDGAYGAPVAATEQGKGAAAGHGTGRFTGD
ncbi:MAG: aminotransferase class I/II-fold pyridoxal phosphate-dependent enzyme [Thiolinea sp.]